MTVSLKVKQAQKGDNEALLQLILDDKDAYYRLALAYMGNEHDALDAMEEMIVILYEKIGQLKQADSFYSWSRTILANQCRAALKKRSKMIPMEQQELDSKERPAASGTYDPYEQRDRRIDICGMLERISPDQREAIELKYFHDFDYEAIAKVTKVSVGTVKSRVFNGLKKLKEWCGGERDGSG